MSDFTQIISDNPIIIPPVQEKVYDKKWLSHFRINSQSPDKATIVAHLVPYNGSDALKEPVTQIVIDNVFSAIHDNNRSVEQRTLFIQAMEIILQAVKSEIDYINNPVIDDTNISSSTSE